MKIKTINISGKAEVTIINGSIENMQVGNNNVMINDFTTSKKKFVTCSYCGNRKEENSECESCGSKK